MSQEKVFHLSPKGKYKKGRRLEIRAKHLLEKGGYTVIRSAASKSSIDLIAFNTESLRLIQVKANKPPSWKERESFYKIPSPSCSVKEIWVYKDKIKVPDIILSSPRSNIDKAKA